MAKKISFEMEMESVVRVAYYRAHSPQKKLITMQTTLVFFFLIGVGFFCWINIRVYLEVKTLPQPVSLVLSQDLKSICYMLLRCSMKI